MNDDLKLFRVGYFYDDGDWSSEFDMAIVFAHNPDEAIKLSNISRGSYVPGVKEISIEVGVLEFVEGQSAYSDE